MTAEQFFDLVRTQTPGSCYLFHGEEEYLKESALRALRKKLLGADLTGLNETVLYNPAAAQVIAVAETFPMLADRRLIVIRECAQLGEKGKAEQGEKAEDEEESGPAAGDSAAASKALAEYVAHIPATSCVVFYARGEASRVKKLYKCLDELGAVVQFSRLQQPALIKWIAKELKAYGKSITHADAEKLLFAVGDNMTQLKAEMGKLAAYAGEREQCTQQDIDAVCIQSTEYRVFDLAQWVVAGRVGQALGLIQSMLAQGESSLMLLALLQRHYRQLVFCKLLGASVRSADSMARQLGTPAFVARRLMDSAAGYGAAQLMQAYSSCTDMELAIKSGRQPEAGALEQLIYSLVAQRPEAT